MKTEVSAESSVLTRADGRFDYTWCPVCRNELNKGHDRELHQIDALERIATALEILAGDA